MYLALYVFLIFLGIIGCLRKNSRYFGMLTLIFAILIVYLHPYCPDYKNYENVYYKIADGARYYDTGIGWYYICLVFTKLGISFRIFKTIMCGISLLLINSTLKKTLNTKNQRYFWVIYLIFPLLLQCIQFRFMTAVALIIYGIPLLIKGTMKDKLIFLLIIGFASLVHSSLLIILTMYFFLLIKPLKKHVKKLTLFGLFILIYMLFLHQDTLISIISKFINEVRIQRYFTMYNNRNNLTTMVYDIFAIFVNYLPLNLMTKRLSTKEKERIGSKFNIIEISSKMNFLFIIIVPFLVLDNNFIRVLEILIMLTNISLLILYEKGIKHASIMKINTYQYIFVSALIYFMIFIPKFVVISSMLT